MRNSTSCKCVVGNLETKHQARFQYANKILVSQKICTYVKQPTDSGCGDGETDQDSCSGRLTVPAVVPLNTMMLVGVSSAQPRSRQPCLCHVLRGCRGGAVLGEALPQQGTPERQWVPQRAARPFVPE